MSELEKDFVDTEEYVDEMDELEYDSDITVDEDVVTDGIKSKSRVKSHGEVYTPKHIVNDMMDLLEKEGYRIDSTILEPACGNGNFLVEILKRKQMSVKEAYDESGNDIDVYNLQLAIAVSCIYGIDILPDNIAEAKGRLRVGTPNDTDHIGYIAQYKMDTGEEMPDWLDKTLVYLMDHNIQLGNTLTNRRLEAADKFGKNTKDAGNLLVSEWNFKGTKVNRVDYYMSDLNSVANDQYRRVDYSRLPRLADLGEMEIAI